MTPICLKRIEPCLFLANPNGLLDQKPFLEFMRRVTPLLAPDFCPPDTIISHLRRDSIEETQIGDLKEGFEIVHTVAIHPHWSYIAGETLQLKAYGLLPDCSLSIIANQWIEGPSPGSSLGLWGNGPETALTVIIESFEAEFSS